MKVCKDCKFAEKKVMQVGPHDFANALMCMNVECRDVLEGNPVPCLNARQADVYCGFNAKHFKVKEEEAKVVTLVQVK